jgi:hypothetical protein
MQYHHSLAGEIPIDGLKADEETLSINGKSYTIERIDEMKGRLPWEKSGPR